MANRPPKKKQKPKGNSTAKTASNPKFPRHSLEQALKIPRAILDQNAGKACSDQDSAKFAGVKYNRGPYAVELSSAIKFGLLDRPESRKVQLTPLARRILRPQDASDELKGLREAALHAPDVSTVYAHFRGENLPDEKFLDNALVDTLGIPQDKLVEFKTVFFATLKFAKLLDEHDGKRRVRDVSDEVPDGKQSPGDSFKPSTVNVSANDTCFVMMPFADPLGSYYEKIYEPAIRRAGMTPIRADNEIFATGKIMDQVWVGINNARVLVAELTTRNPNVFYELGLAHALKKPVVLISSNEGDVPFDLHHIRVIYYDVNDPFWGAKLLDKVAENIISAIKNPEEAIFRR